MSGLDLELLIFFIGIILPFYVGRRGSISDGHIDDDEAERIRVEAQEELRRQVHKISHPESVIGLSSLKSTLN